MLRIRLASDRSLQHPKPLISDPGTGSTLGGVDYTALRTPRLLVRAVRPEDAGALHERRNHPEVAECQGSPEPMYLGYGFVPTGEIVDGEIEARLTFES